MSYQVLATKWRPRSFKDIVGQSHVVMAIKNSLKKNMLHNAYLFTGTRGVGKTTIARILAKSFNCENLINGEPCNICNSCSHIDKGNFIDLFELDAASNTGVDSIREILDNSLYLPTSGKYKVYIIDEVHMLSKSAFNAMLKTLEDPPKHAKFILATTEANKIPVTVLSRCLQFALYNLNLDQISHRLEYILNEENIKFEIQALLLISRFAFGSMRDALSLLDQAIAIGNGEVLVDNVRKMLGIVDRNYLFDLLKNIHNNDKDNIFKFLKDISLKNINFEVILGELAVFLQEIALFQIQSQTFDISNIDYDLIKELSIILHPEEVQIYYQCILEGKKDLHINPDEYSGFMMSILRMIAFSPLYLKDDDEKDIFIENKKKNVDTLLISNDTFLHKSKVDSLPAICKDNWHEVIHKMSNYLGPLKICARYTRLVSLDENTIYLAIDKEGSNYFNIDDIKKKLIDIFIKYYSIDIKFVDWDDNYSTVKNLVDKEVHLEKQKILDILNDNKIVKELKKDLDLDWDLNSLKLNCNE